MDATEWVEGVRRYDARRDRLVVFVVALVVATDIGAAVTVLVLDEPVLEALRPILVPVLLISAAVLPWLVASTRYEVTPTHLLLRMGPIRIRVPLAKIVSIKASTGLAMARNMGWSSNYLLVAVEGKRLDWKITPEAQERFLDHLARNDPGLEREADGVARRGEAQETGH